MSALQSGHDRFWSALHVRLRLVLPVICMSLCGCSGRKPATILHPAAPSAQEAALGKVRQQPNDPAARQQLAEQYAHSGETFAAIEQMEVARQLGDSDSSLALRLAELYTTLGETEAAAESLATAALKPGVTLDVRLAYSRELLQLGDFEAAANAVRPLLSQRTDLLASTQQDFAHTFLLAGDAREANALLPRDSSDPQWLALRGLQALLNGQPKQAASALTRSVALDPQNGRTAYLLGKAWLAAGEPRNALDAWSRAAELPNSPAEAAIGAAQLLAQSNRLDEANAMLQHVQGENRKTPGYWQVLYRIAQQSRQPAFAQTARGYTAYYSGDPWQAEAIWRAALPQAQRDDAWALYVALSNSALQRQDARAALHYATEAVARFPQDYYLLKSLAEILLDQNRLAAAQTVAERLKPLETPDKAGQADALLARIALKFGKPDLLKQSVQRQRKLAPHDPTALLYLVEWQYQQPRTEQNLQSALKLCQEAISIAPDNADAYYRAGLLLKELKRPQEAISMLLHALTLSPRLQDGAPNAILAQLEQRQGLLQESRFELRQNRRLRTMLDIWPDRIKLLYQTRSAPTLAEWKELGALALNRHELWVALCAATRATRLAPKDPSARQLLAATWQRLGRFDAALKLMARGS